MFNTVETTCSEIRELYFFEGTFRTWTVKDQTNFEVL